MASLVEVVCSVCSQVFHRPLNRYNEALRKGWSQTCSSACRCLLQTTGSLEPCLSCGKDVWITKSARDASQTGRFYCGHTCAATLNNRGRVRSAESRGKTREAIRKNLISKGITPLEDTRTCEVCGESFVPYRKDLRACSTTCGWLMTHGQLPVTREELIEIITKKFSETGCTPSTKPPENQRLVFAAKKHFGSWNALMLFLGIKPNTRYKLRRRVKCSDGHLADSLSERLVDDWMHHQGLVHERYKHYPNQKRMPCDFYLPEHDLWVEYAGLSGEFRNYDKTLEAKKALAVKYRINLVLIKPEHLYPTMNLDWVLDAGRLP